MLISVDFETRSLVDIKKAGARRYAEDPSTEILCMAWAIDDQEPEIWLPGQPFPTGFTHYSKLHAFKAEFEIAIWKHCHPSDWPDAPAHMWHDTMGDAAMCGFPLALGKCAKALGTAEKLDSGTRLITKLCKPKADGTFREYKDFPVDFHHLYEYCKQDVVAERDVYNALPYHVKGQEDTIQRLTWLSNDRGVPIDVTSVQVIQTRIESFMESIDHKVQRLTNGHLNSARQKNALLMHLEMNRGASDKFIAARDFRTESGLKNPRLKVGDIPGVTLDNLRGEETAKVLTEWDISDYDRELIGYQRDLNHASVAKFKKILLQICKDGTVKDNIQYHGAGTGRDCFTDTAEVLTPDGWCLMSEYDGYSPILQWGNGKLTWCMTPTMNRYSVIENMIRIENNYFHHTVTPEHRMVERKKKRNKVITAAEAFDNVNLQPILSGEIGGDFRPDIYTRFCVMVQADGYYRNQQIGLSFVKHRKIERCRALLDDLGVEYRYVTSKARKNKSAYGHFYIKLSNLPTWLQNRNLKRFDWWLFECDPLVFTEEIAFWDGSRPSGTSCEYGSVIKENAEWVQTMAHLCGHSAKIQVKERPEDNWNTYYRVNIRKSSSTLCVYDTGDSRQMAYKKKVYYEGDVFCPTVTTGFFLVRQQNKISVTGNSARGFQLQNLPRLTEENPEQLLKFFYKYQSKDLELLFDVLGTASTLIRPMICAPQGKKLIVSDYGQIEARGTAWLVLEEDILQNFRDGIDPYKAQASDMYHVELEDVTKIQRQYGKLVILAAGFQGSHGALTAFAALYGLTLERKESYGTIKKFRAARPKLVAAWYAFSEAAIAAVRDAGTPYAVQNCKNTIFQMRGQHLTMKLPSGRMLWYPYAKVETVTVRYEDGGTGKIKTFQTTAMTSMWVSSYTTKWERRQMSGGNLFQNAVQALSRDLLMEAVIRLEDCGYPVIARVHDELICLCDDTPMYSVQELDKLMCVIPSWATDFPLSAEGYSSRRYKK